MLADIRGIGVALDELLEFPAGKFQAAQADSGVDSRDEVEIEGLIAAGNACLDHFFGDAIKEYCYIPAGLNEL